jgi:multiple sugar transport system permease protein
MSIKKKKREIMTGLGFLAPNIIGFMIFTIIPLGLSFYLAFSNWDLKLHNMFKQEAIKMVGFDNFIRLLSHPDFWRFLGNTFFFMIGMPFAVAGSLILALLLGRDMKGTSRKVYGQVIAGTLLFSCTIMLVLIGCGSSAIVILITGVFCGALIMGSAGGSVVYRTLFYLPYFTSGVATYILWKKIYNPYTGPLNTALQPVLTKVADGVNYLPSKAIQSGYYILLLLMLLLFTFGISRLRIMLSNRNLKLSSSILPLIFLLIPIYGCYIWAPVPIMTYLIIAGVVITIIYNYYILQKSYIKTTYSSNASGNALMLTALIMIGEFILLGIGIVLFNLPEMAIDGLEPPLWLNNYYWAKPALIIMGVWGAIGSNNMLLYLAGIMNVPQELYEAADIDGASGFQKFWNVTWPQLAPTTFFIVVMSVMGGLKGGFEMAKSMTQGGPAGSTTTLAYFIYTEGFETGRLGYSSAIAWIMFIIIFSITIFNWKFGNRYVND